MLEFILQRKSLHTSFDVIGYKFMRRRDVTSFGSFPGLAVKMISPVFSYLGQNFGLWIGL